MPSPMLLNLSSSTGLHIARTVSRDTISTQRCKFSSSAPRWPRGVKGSNKMRGMSAIRSKGRILNKIRSIRPWQLPVPVMDPSKRATVTTGDDHGLWGFFNTNKEALTDPKDLNAHGRAWTKKELSIKSLYDMQALWWKCHLELNQLSTEREERKRLNPGYGEYELDGRKDVIEDTQKAIREALEERYDAWIEAKDILEAEKDDDIKIGAEGYIEWRQTYEEPYSIDEMDEKDDLPATTTRRQ